MLARHLVHVSAGPADHRASRGGTILRGLSPIILYHKRFSLVIVPMTAWQVDAPPPRSERGAWLQSIPCADHRRICTNRICRRTRKLPHVRSLMCCPPANFFDGQNADDLLVARRYVGCWRTAAVHAAADDSLRLSPTKVQVVSSRTERSWAQISPPRLLEEHAELDRRPGSA